VVTDSQQTVLVVDDEEIVRDVLVRYLERSGFRTLSCGDGVEARSLIEQHEQDLALVVLDVMLPGIDGLELCRWLRARSSLPVLLLTARGEETDRIVGLELGADDYVTKPFSPREVVARVRSILRRTVVQRDVADAAVQTPVTLGELRIDPISRIVKRGTEELRLTAREFELLYFLARNAGEVFSRDQLMGRVWGYQAAHDTGTVSVHMRRLREKIEDDPSAPRYLQTVWGVGYRASAP